MAEVGVLNLQVRAGGTDQATQSLRQLAGALQRVRNAVSGGIRLAAVGTSIERFATRINQAVNNGTIAKINRLGEALQRLNNLGNLSNVTINIRDGNIASVRERVNQVSESTRTLVNEIATLRQILSDGSLFGDLDESEAAAIQGRIAELEGSLARFAPVAQSAAEAAVEISSGLERVGEQTQTATNAIDTFAERARTTTSLVASMAWQFGDAANNAATFTEEFMRAFELMNRMRMSRALGPGGGGDSSSTEWTYYNPWGDVQETGWTYWKDGAIEVEGTVSSAMETISNRIEGAKVLLLGAGEEIQTQVSETVSAQRQIESASDSAGTNTANAFTRVGTAINEAREYLRDFAWLIRQIPGAISSLGSGLGRMMSPLTNILKQFSRIAKYRAIRAVIKSITDGFKEGVENVYKYSQAIGSGFADSMDNAASALLTMKNSIGAAVAPAIQALIPVLQTVVNWFITLVNYVNQFISLMMGQNTWIHAVDATTSAYEDQTHAAHGAAAAVKDLLADWDELNIIQSESGGGGTGTGTNAAEDYLNMFEELATFDNRIKKIVEYIQDHFDEIKKLAIAIGAAVLGWKISKAFDGVLGQIGRLIAGASLLYFSVELGYGSGFSAGLKGYFDKYDIAGVIGAAIAGGIGGWLISGSAEGIAVGVIVGITASLIGYLEGDKEGKDLLKWGEGSMTPEQVEEYVTGLFAFNITSRMQVLDAVIENQEDAKKTLNGKVQTFSESLDKVQIGVMVDGSPKGIIKASEAAKDVVDQINQNLAASEKNVEILAKIKPLTNSESDGTASMLDSLKVADKTLSEYFTGIGEEIAHWIDEGQKSGWKNNEAEMALELMQHQQSILDKAEQNKIHRDFQVDSEMNLSGLSRDTVEDIFNKEVEMINEYEEKYRTALENQAKELFYYADLSDAAGLTDDEGNPLSNVYKTAAEGLLGQIKSGAYLEELQPTLDIMRQQWIKAISDVYGKDISNYVDLGANEYLGVGNWKITSPKLESTISEAYAQALFDEEHGGIAGGMQIVKDRLEEELWNAFNTIDPHGIAKKAAKNFNFSIFDLLGTDDIGQLVQSTLNVTNNDTDATYKILNALGIDSAKIAEAIKLNISNGVETGAKEATEYIGNVDLFKRPVISAKDLATAGWDIKNADDWATLFSSTITGADIGLGGIEAETVIGITPILPDGTVLSPDQLDSYVEELFSESNKTGKSIKEVDAGKWNLLLDIDTKSADENIENAIKRVDEKMQKIHEEQEQLYNGQAIAEGIGGSLPEIEYAVDVVEDPSLTQPIQTPGIDNSEFNRTLNERVDAAAEAARLIREYLGMMSGFAPFTGPVSGYREHARPAIAYASGGFVRSGDMVMANENGNFEMMGRMGRQPVIANNQQIVDGISRGVSNANGTMVGEMRNMVALMQRMLNKEFVAKAVPSSSWGRNNSKSAEAYSKVTG